MTHGGPGARKPRSFFRFRHEAIPSRHCTYGVDPAARSPHAGSPARFQSSPRSPIFRRYGLLLMSSMFFG